MNGNKFATGEILEKSVEVVKGRILAQKSPEPCSCKLLHPGFHRVTRPPQAAVGNESWFVGDSRALGTSPGVGPPTRGTLAELEEDLARNFAGHPAVSLPLGVASGCASPCVVAAAPSALQIWCPSTSSPLRASGGGKSYRSDRKGEKRKRKRKCEEKRKGEEKFPRRNGSRLRGLDWKKSNLGTDGAAIGFPQLKRRYDFTFSYSQRSYADF
jgi:hypothetical protein